MYFGIQSDYIKWMNCRDISEVFNSLPDNDHPSDPNRVTVGIPSIKVS